MKYEKTIIILALLLILPTGCAKRQLYSEGRYAESVKSVDQRVQEVGVARSYDLIELCSSLSQLKQYNRLFKCLDQLEDNVKKGDRRSSDPWGLTFDTTENLLWPSDVSTVPFLLRAQAYIELEQYAPAIAAAQKAYDLAHTAPLLWGNKIRIRALGLISLAYALKGEPGESRKALARLEETSTSMFGFLPNLKEKKLIITRTHMALGDYDNILASRNDIYDAFTSSLMNIAHGRGRVIEYMNRPYHFMINKALFETGKIEEARRGYDDLLTKPGIQQSGEIYWSILFDRGKIAEKEGNLKASIEFYGKAVDVIELQRSTIHTEASKIGFIGDKQAVYHHLISGLYRSRQYEKAFEYVERAKARALVDVLASKKDFAIKRNNDEHKIKAALALNDSIDEEAISQDISIDTNKTRSVQIKIRQDLKERTPELASLITVTSQPVSELQTFISPEETLIEYYYRGDEMYAFILSDRSLQTVKLDSKGLSDAVQTFRKLIDTPSSPGQFMEWSGKLYDRLFRPLERTLSTKNLVIVPHGVLHYLPLNALHDGNGYIIDRYSIRMMPSASAMKYLMDKKTAQQKGVLIFGNPDLGDPAHDLEYAQQEAAAIARIRPQSKIFVRKAATEEMFRRHAKDYRYIHLATHGRFTPGAPLQSALFLSPDTKHDGVLTADKLYTLDLDADLVTLSACETGLSKIANGDDLVGLTRGFLYAGSRSIVASLWKVDDLATSHLMTRFYGGLDSAGKREALRTAQLETKKKYPHPYYWASFQLTGNAR